MFDPNMKVLVVDDMMTMRKLVKRALSGYGLNNVDADSDDGQKAWAKLNEQPDFKLIVSDWNMPNCTGLDLLKRVRSDSRFKTLPFILLTAEGEAGQVKEAMTLGVSGYVLKPFTPESLKAQIDKIFGVKAA